jgi:hypothetical protein
MLGVIEEVAHRGKDGAGAPCDLLALLGEFDARLRRSTMLTLSSSSSSLICILKAGWLTAQASGAWPKWRVFAIRRAYRLHK